VTSGKIPVVVVGGGPAGLGAAWRLARRGVFDVTLVERAGAVGGNASSFNLAGINVDYGSHRLHPACAPEILGDIRSMLGPDLLDRPRHGRIRLEGRWLHFPLRPLDLVRNAPPRFLAGVFRDTCTKGLRNGDAPTFATVLERGLGRTIARSFYFPYAEKIWGLAPEALDAEQARRRVSAGSISKLVRKVLGALPGFRPSGAGRFFYPKRGYGQIAEAYRDAALAAGVRILLNAELETIDLGGGAPAVTVRGAAGRERLPAAQVLSTISLTTTARAVRPAPPPAVAEAAAALRYRGMILIYLVLDAERFTEYDAHYFPARATTITRLSEPKNYAGAAAPGTTVLCAELPCDPSSALWGASDEALGELVRKDLAANGIPVRAAVRAVVARRLREAYPIYERGYRAHFDRIDAWFSGLDGVLTLGRQGLFVHDNTHHTLAMAYAAAACVEDSGRVDRGRWARFRESFQSHVVED
jgi:protoporphyrinogen oxidase